MSKRARDPEAQRAYHRRWREANREKVRDADRRWKARHPDKVRAQSRARRAPEKLEQSRARDRAHKQKVRREQPCRLREQYKEWRYRNPEQQMLKQARMRAKKRGLVFEITVDDVVIPARCPIFGTPIVLASKRRIEGQAGHGFEPDSPSLDRIDPTRGYVRGNVWVISNRANVIKRDASLSELEAIARAVRKRLIPPPARTPRQDLRQDLLPLEAPPAPSPPPTRKVAQKSR